MRHILYVFSDQTVFSKMMDGILGDIDGLMQKRRNSSANALELRLFHIERSIYWYFLNAQLNPLRLSDICIHQ